MAENEVGPMLTGGETREIAAPVVESVQSTADEDEGNEPQGMNTPMTWFAVLAEPVPLCMTRVVIGPTKRELKQKLDGVDAKNVQMIIRGREVMKTMKINF